MKLRDGMRMEIAWLDGEDRFGEYALPAFRPVQ